jgi:hypothetical protein
MISDCYLSSSLHFSCNREGDGIDGLALDVADTEWSLRSAPVSSETKIVFDAKVVVPGRPR